MAANDMSASDSCRRAVFAASEVIAEECTDKQFSVEEIDNNVLALVPQDAKEEFGFDTNSPQTESEREEAIDECVDSNWAQSWAESVLGPDASEDELDRAARRVCEGLFEPA